MLHALPFVLLSSFEKNICFCFFPYGKRVATKIGKASFCIVKSMSWPKEGPCDESCVNRIDALLALAKLAPNMRLTTWNGTNLLLFEHMHDQLLATN